ncbi:MAG TPA: hypothetical protein VHF25_10585, partial [Nitriliruptorales bacterium]|nr:hypothetical protein [Nitriliruptorales bacterium]
MRILVLTNDLPPRAGGIEQFLANLLARAHPESTVVVACQQVGEELLDPPRTRWQVVGEDQDAHQRSAMRGCVRCCS